MSDKDLAWAYLPLPIQKRVQQGKRSRLSYIKLGESFAQRGLRYSDVLRYMKLDSDTLDQEARDAIDAGYRRATGWVDMPKITKPVVKKTKPKTRKKKPPKKRKSRAKAGVETWIERYLVLAHQHTGASVNFPRTKRAPTQAEGLKSLLRASGVPISIRELKQRYPAYSPRTGGARRLVPVLIDRELILYTLAKAISPKEDSYRLMDVVKQLLRARLAPARKTRRYLAKLAEKRLADLADPTVPAAEEESDSSPDMPSHI